METSVTSNYIDNSWYDTNDNAIKVLSVLLDILTATSNTVDTLKRKQPLTKQIDELKVSVNLLAGIIEDVSNTLKNIKIPTNISHDINHIIEMGMKIIDISSQMSIYEPLAVENKVGIL